MKNKELRDLDAALAQLRRQPTRPKLSFRIAHTIKLLLPSFTALNESETEIRKRHIEYDSLGQEKMEGPDLVFKAGHSIEDLHRELNELFETDSGATLPEGRFVLRDFDDAQFSIAADVLIKLGSLVNLEH